METYNPVLHKVLGGHLAPKRETQSRGGSAHWQSNAQYPEGRQESSWPNEMWRI